jgi:hypothetical protein
VQQLPEVPNIFSFSLFLLCIFFRNRPVAPDLQCEIYTALTWLEAGVITKGGKLQADVGKMTSQ